MKKSNLSYEELLKCHLRHFEADFGNVKTNGIIFVEDEAIYLLQNTNSGYNPKNNELKNYGYKYSWIYQIKWNKSYSITNLIVDVEEEWKPQFGELVFIPEIEETRIFIFEKDSMFACVSIGEEEKFKNNHCFSISFWNEIKQIQPQIEISIKEAKEIVAKEKGVDVDKITIKID